MTKQIMELRKELEAKGFEVRSEKQIQMELDFQEETITILSDGQFKVEVDMTDGKARLETTYSNQKVDGKYMEDINALYQIVNQ